MAASVSDSLDRLYATPLDGFVALRKELAAELRAAGDVAGSREVAAAKKPSRPAWALNQVARRNAGDLRAAFEAHTAAAKAQAGGDGDTVRDTVRAFRDALGEVVKAAARIADEGGVALSAAQVRQLGETIRAAIGGDSREQLLAGRLTEDAEVDDPFAGLEASPGRKVTPRAPEKAESAAKASEGEKGAPAPTARERDAQRAREERERDIEAAKRRLDALEQEAREARIAAHQAEVVARRAEAEAEKARRVATAFEEPLEKARAALAALKEKR
jgi:hypothetical protein